MEIFDGVPSFLAWNPPYRPEIIGKGLLPTESKMVVAGPYKVFKSMLLQQMGFCVSEGIPFIGFPTARTKVLIVQFEIAKSRFRERLRKYQAGQGGGSNLAVSTALMGIRIDTPAGLQEIEAGLNQVKPGLLILDPLYKIISGSESSAEELQRLFNHLDYLIHQYGISLVISAHCRKLRLDAKGQVVDLGLDEIMGSVRIPGWVDSAILIQRLGGDNRRLLFEARHREDDLPPVEISFNRNTLEFKVVGGTGVVGSGVGAPSITP